MIRFALRMFHWMRRSPRAAAGVILGLVGVSLAGNALTFYFFDAGGGTRISFGDALWYSIVSITTIGYGDYAASSLGARLGTIFFIVLLGLAAFTIFLGLLADKMSDAILKGQRGLGMILADDHILIVNFPNATRVRQIIQELQRDPQHAGRLIVVITDQIEQLPFRLDNVQFVAGSPLEEDVYVRARAHKARMAIVLSPSYANPDSDALVAAAVTVIESISHRLLTVAECLEHSHRRLFKATRCDAVVSGLEIASNLLVQETYDPGVARVLGEITSNQRGTTLFSTTVTDEPGAVTYNRLAKSLLDHGVNLLGVLRDDGIHTRFDDKRARAGDKVIYVGERRRNWDELLARAGEG